MRAAWRVAIVKFALGQDIGNRPLLLTSILLMTFSIQFITTGIIAEMLSRIFYQGRETPGALAAPAETSINSSDWALPANAKANLHG